MKELEIKDARLAAYEGQKPPPAPEKEEPIAPAAVEQQEYDMYTAEGQAAFQQSIVNNIATATQGIGESIRTEMTGIREQERTSANINSAMGELNSFVAEHKIPKEIVDSAMTEYSRKTESPFAAVRDIMSIINSNFRVEATQKKQAAVMKEAAEKAKLLKANETPAGETPPLATQPTGKTAVVKKFEEAGQTAYDKM